MTLFTACISTAQSSYQNGIDGKLMFKSTGAIEVAEKIRAKAPGVMMETFVKVGDFVNKGDILGHTELDNTKLQLDLAKRALNNQSTVDAAEAQAKAWSVNRGEVEEQVMRRKQEKSRLEWALAMEKMYHENYQNQLELKKVQQVQYDYWQSQYEKRFFHAPVDGMVTQVLVDVGKSVNYATHVFTVCNKSSFTIPVAVPTAIGDAISPADTLPIRAADGKTVKHARVDSVIENPRSAGEKIINLLVSAEDFPAYLRLKLEGMKFDVLLPLARTDIP